jgi:hypothetical protein
MYPFLCSYWCVLNALTDNGHGTIGYLVIAFWPASGLYVRFTLLAAWLFSGLLFWLLFGPEDGGNNFLRNAGGLLLLKPIRLYFSSSLILRSN